ncbi:MAG: ral secretion pathway protein B-like protein [Ramlibacter sp.]|nr:ral secretion pathway protein B-like protein [Ramlibacter sp.]
MSYILDALRKADAQRERDPARGIHAQPLRAPLGEARGEAAYRPWFWVATIAGVAALAAAGWYLYRDNGPAAPAPRAVEVAQAVRTQLPIAPPAAPVQPPPVVVAAPAPAVLPPPQPIVRPQSTIPNGPRPLVSARAAAQGAQGPQSGPMAPPAAVPAAPPAPPTPPVSGLPPDAPKLVITGGVYSTNRAQRMVIINGQVFREGADLGSGVALEEIRAKSVVLRFRGARYSAGY